jgi:dTDP-4-amino-4,6-dideoxygalactose transaminase
VVVHFSGLSCDMSSIKKLSIKYKFKIIEDSCHALGGKYKKNLIGSCKYSDISMFSFHPVKSITTGEGGVALTNNQLLADRMRLLRSHGIRKKDNLNSNKNPPWYYEQNALGFNYRMSDIHAALGISQLKKIDTFIYKRKQIAQTYHEQLSDMNLQLPFMGENYDSSHHLFVIRIKSDKIKKNHSQVFNYLQNHNIGVNLHYIPIYRQPFFRSMGFEYSDFPESESYYSEAISIPIFPKLTKLELKYIVSTIKNSIK